MQKMTEQLNKSLVLEEMEGCSSGKAYASSPKIHNLLLKYSYLKQVRQ